VYRDRMIVKFLRRIDEGVNPDLEIGRFLTERTAFRHMPPVAGAVEFRQHRKAPVTLAIVHGYVPNEGDAWSYTLDVLDRYFEQVLASLDSRQAAPLTPGHVVELLGADIPQEAVERIGVYLESARRMAEVTADLHAALASRGDDPAMAPEPFGAMYQRSLYQSVRTRAEQVFTLLERRLRSLDKDVRADARRVLGLQNAIRSRFRAVLDRKIKAQRIRVHGDYHLGQLLYTGRDFVVLDFEGEPTRAIGERRLKRSPLRDVAGILRSFHYATVSALHSGKVRGEDVAVLEPWADAWYQWVSVAFLRAYTEHLADGHLLSHSKEDWQVLLDIHLLDKALYELAYELNNRPEWVIIPLRGILQLLEPAGSR